MTYIEGFVTAVPSANRAVYLAHAEAAHALLAEFGVTRMVEAWGDDVPDGKVTDFARAVQRKEDETVVFSWFEYPDKAARDAANAKLMSDPRMAEMAKDMPFDGARMIWGGFDGVHDAGTVSATGYIDGVILPVTGGRDAYEGFAADMAGVFLDSGATRVMDAIADDVQPGKVTDFLRAVQVEGEESVGFGWVEWPDKATRNAGWEKIMADPRMQGREAPFDGKRMIFGGFVPILDR